MGQVSFSSVHYNAPYFCTYYINRLGLLTQQYLFCRIGKSDLLLKYRCRVDFSPPIFRRCIAMHPTFAIYYSNYLSTQKIYYNFFTSKPLEFAEKQEFSRKLRGTVSSKATCYPTPSLALTHLRSDLKKYEKLSFFDFFRILYNLTLAKIQIIL